MTKWKPHYDLQKAKKLIFSDKYMLVRSAYSAAFSLNFNQARIKDALLNIEQTDFSKSEEDWHIPGQWQDAYKTCYEGHRLYVKWKIIDNHGEKLQVLSFKVDQGDVL